MRYQGYFFRTAGLCGSLLLTAFVTGCGDDRPDLAPVSGSVELDGKPLTEFDHAAVIFTPKGGRTAKGVIDPSDGTFELTTYRSGDGAIVGPALVSVSATVDDSSGPEDKYQGVRWVIPKDFADRDLSGLRCEVVAGEKNVFRVRISSDGTGVIEAE